MSLVNAGIHRQLAVACFNQCWDLIDKTDRSEDDDAAMIRLAEVSYWHWQQVDVVTAKQISVGCWQLARVLPSSARGRKRVTTGKSRWMLRWRASCRRSTLPMPTRGLLVDNRLLSRTVRRPWNRPEARPLKSTTKLSDRWCWLTWIKLQQSKPD